MKKLSVSMIKPVKATQARKVSTNITEVLDFQIETVEAINKAIAEFNAVLPRIVEPFDDSTLVEAIQNLKAAIPKAYDDKTLIARVKKLEEIKPVEVDIAKIKKALLPSFVSIETVEAQSKELAEAKKKIELLTVDFSLHKKAKLLEVEKLTETLKLNQAELRSVRNNLGGQLDEMRQQLNKLTEIK